MLASVNGHLGCILALIDAGADLHIKSNDNKKTALSLAKRESNSECVEALIKAGAEE